MLYQLKVHLQNELERCLRQAFPSLKENFSDIELDQPADKNHGQFSTNIALKSAKFLKRPPSQIAQDFKNIFEQYLFGSTPNTEIAKIEVKGPGFINFFLSPAAYYNILANIFKLKDRCGASSIGQGKKIQIEFVSANPTGPLSVAHARQAAVGDALANILRFLNFDVCKEYYVNDEGNQINILGNSIRLRALQILKEDIQFPDDHYQGEYIKEMGRIFLQENNIQNKKQLEALAQNRWNQFAVDYLLNIIKKELDDFGVDFDVWSFQSKIATQKNIEAILDYLGEKGFLYEKEGALWFRSTDFRDDKDRVVKKSDGTYTYLAPDMVYHKNKFERNFHQLINIWGPDHHGYIPRITAFVEALGHGREEIKVLIVQLATIFREGNPVSMSTRRGQYISLREVIEEVGVDAARFFFLMRHINQHLEFDLDLAKKQTAENPVYYIQYAHARVHSMNKKAKETNIKVEMEKFSLLKEEEEIDLITLMGNFPETLRYCHDQSDPYPLVSYLQELATMFHKFYDCHRVVDPQNSKLSSERLGLANAAGIIFANGLELLGVSTPETM